MSDPNIIKETVEARSEKIDKSVKQAEEIEARMKTSETEREEMLKTSRLEAQEIIKKAGEDAEARGKVLADKAREEVTKIVAQGKEQMATERQEMLASVRAEIADLAVLVAEKILEDQVDKKTSEALAKKTLEEAGVSL
ncbi:MAG: ATP synthase subunit b [Candidatus Giovannonibacteria bacterium GW2011_GWA2_53_7]|uniref:ATP synthase subunit b n=1 Tax=Candidatus Giovannonibacteria bacterium GW2011_GWA2_53_7 TaxID=1618650 RepID=A0A0G1XUU2_9BACT|nr:MAG: ATP synthase subunit b [Candidatus Giovannonibacteria bacterium GW2011_GWA2_53_7]